MNQDLATLTSSLVFHELLGGRVCAIHFHTLGFYCVYAYQNQKPSSSHRFQSPEDALNCFYGLIDHYSPRL